MAIAKRCDVCGKFYSDNDKKFTANDYKVGGVSLLTIGGNRIVTYDMCDECSEKVFNFLEGKRSKLKGVSDGTKSSNI